MAENYSVDCCLSGGADDSGFSSPGFCYESSGANCSPENASLRSESGRRGRPKAAMITSLMKEGAVSRSGIRCEICSRVFPRDKSLQAHLRVHTGERPYSCDYPGCVRKFKQSGQLKTHQRLHTGERPFLCSASGCKNRFTHANRHCSCHPGAALVRSDDFVPYNPDTAQSEEVRLWLIRYMTEKREPKSEKKVRRGDGSSEEQRNDSEETLQLSDASDSLQRHGNTVAELADISNLQPVTAPAATPVPDCNGTTVGSPLHHHVRSPLRCAGRRTPLHELLRSPVRSQRTPMRDYLRSPGRTAALRTPLHELLRSPLACFDLYSPSSLPSARCPPYSTLRYDELEYSEADEPAVAWSTPLPACRPAVKSLFVDSPSPMLSPRKRELPKKRWLRIARREEESSANSRRPTVLRYLPSSDSHSVCRALHDSTPTQTTTTPSCLMPSADTTPCRPLTTDSTCVRSPSQSTYTPLSTVDTVGSPLLSRLLTMPHSLIYEEDHTPLAVPLPQD